MGPRCQPLSLHEDIEPNTLNISYRIKVVQNKIITHINFILKKTINVVHVDFLLKI